MEIKSRSRRTQVEPLRRSEQNLAATLYQGTLTLPLAHQAACSEWRDVRRVCQLLVRDLEFNTARCLPADGASKGQQHLSNSLPNSVTG